MTSETKAIAKTWFDALDKGDMETALGCLDPNIVWINVPKIKDGSRLDFLLKSNDEKSCYIEVKSSTLSRFPNTSEFPDSVTSRGSKHLSLLANLKNDGFRAIQIYLIQRNDTNCFKIAKDIDHQYFKSFQIAKKSGVEILILQSLLSYDGIELSKKRL